MGQRKKDGGSSEIALNKKAKFNFELQEFFEAGIMLSGSEVKSLREKKANLTDSFAKFKNGELFLESFHITPYINGGYANHPEIRSRKLLLKSKELSRLQKVIKEKGLTIVAVKSYFNDRGFAKVQIATAKPKKNYDKRDTIQAREGKIEIERAFKGKSRYE
ncbi:MAG: SsrA-binding protein SmpB [Leptospiraceae bacterium]|nr:SsrA-binding protein SmpB [Leptospiraceae bacterium]